MANQVSNGFNGATALESVEKYLRDNDLDTLVNDFVQGLENPSWGGEFRAQYFDRMLTKFEAVPQGLGSVSLDKVSQVAGELLFANGHVIAVQASDGKIMNVPKLFILSSNFFREMLLATDLKEEEPMELSISEKALKRLMKTEKPDSLEMCREILVFCDKYEFDAKKSAYTQNYNEFVLNEFETSLEAKSKSGCQTLTQEDLEFFSDELGDVVTFEEQEQPNEKIQSMVVKLTDTPFDDHVSQKLCKALNLLIKYFSEQEILLSGDVDKVLRVEGEGLSEKIRTEYYF